MRSEWRELLFYSLTTPPPPPYIHTHFTPHFFFFLQRANTGATAVNIQHIGLVSERKFSYSVKVINPAKKSEYVVQKLRVTKRFESVDEIKENLVSTIQGLPSVIDQLGYIEPGHGAKGRQRWLSSYDDLKDMYSLHEKKLEILLWCYSSRQTSSSNPSSSKRPHSPEQPQSSQKRSRYSTHSEKMIEVESIEDKLLEKHDGKYSREQIRAWAHLIQMGKHGSYESAPNKPFWKTPSGKKSMSSESAVSVSPGKKIQLQGQLVDQLLKWHDLLEKGGIDQKQYEEIKANIMGDVKKF